MLTMNVQPTAPVQFAKSIYWDQLVNYYYNHVHWTETEPPSIYSWLEREYGARSYRFHNIIEFDDPANATAFMLRWAYHD